MIRAAWILLAALPLAAHAVTYKWRDANGRLMFTQLPPANGIPYETLGGAPPPADAPNQEALNQTLENDRREAPKRQREAEQASAAQAQRDEACRAAMERLAYLDSRTARRLGTTDAQGNESRMTDEEFARRRAETQEAVNKNCG